MQVGVHSEAQVRWINGKIKACLMAESYTQTYGIEYHDTFTPMIKMKSVRVLMFLAVNRGWSLP